MDILQTVRDPTPSSLVGSQWVARWDEDRKIVLAVAADLDGSADDLDLLLKDIDIIAR